MGLFADLTGTRVFVASSMVWTYSEPGNGTGLRHRICLSFGPLSKSVFRRAPSHVGSMCVLLFYSQVQRVRDDPRMS